MNLLIEYFVPESKERHTEYITCLKHNLKNEFITKIHIFIDGEDNLPDDIDLDKIVINRTEKRNTYHDFFEYSNKLSDTCILSNGDIIFDDSLQFLHKENTKDKFIALSRWDILPNGNIRHYDIPYSQDVWIYNPGVNIKNCMFNMGRLGCDNRISFLAMKSGLIVTNPSKKIITRHLHLSKYRTGSSDPSKIIQGPYLFVDSNDNIDIPSENILVSPQNMRNTIDKINHRKINSNN